MNSNLEKKYSLTLLFFQTLVIGQWPQMANSVRILNFSQSLVSQVYSSVTRPCWHLICLNGLINTYLQIISESCLQVFTPKWTQFYIGLCLLVLRQLCWMLRVFVFWALFWKPLALGQMNIWVNKICWTYKLKMRIGWSRTSWFIAHSN